MPDTLIYLSAFLLLLGVLIVIHECGHFFVARWFGVRILQFSVGFGPVIWSRRAGKDQTLYSVSLLPLGGFVRMLDEREADARIAPEDVNRTFNRQSVGRRSAIVAAGPAANFLLAIVIFWALFWFGAEARLPVLGPPAAGTPAAQAGLQNGDRVLSVEGISVSTWEDFLWRLLKQAAARSEVALEVLDEQNRTRVVRLDVSLPADQGWEGDVLGGLGVRPYKPPFPPVVGRVFPGSPAEQAGILPGDRILSIEGEPVTLWGQVFEYINASAKPALSMEIMRDSKPRSLQLMPKEVEERGRRFRQIGIEVQTEGFVLPVLQARVQYGFFEAGIRAVRETWSKSAFNLTMFGKMLTGEASWRNLSGPGTIAEYAGRSAKLGVSDYLKFMALVSIGLGILNLLPIPVLDGGHLLYHICEMIKGAPLSERAMALGQRFGMLLLFTLMGFAIFNDLTRYLGRLFNG